MIAGINELDMSGSMNILGAIGGESQDFQLYLIFSGGSRQRPRYQSQTNEYMDAVKALFCRINKFRSLFAQK
jgi:hypothetical protein